jgi:prepilin-type N-terminal cleavage/methylation domain-containing protein
MTPATQSHRAASAHVQTPWRADDRAFTLLELIVVMAIIAILLGLVLIAMGGVSKAGIRADSANSLRQMMRAYISYSNDHSNKLMPGYVDPVDLGTGPNQLDIVAELSDGTKLSPGDTAPYIWRLLPYLDYEWSVFTADYRAKGVDARLNEEISVNDAFGPGSASASDEIGLGIRPSFGLNSIYVGGDSHHGGSDAVALNPWSPTTPGVTIAATRMSEILNTSRLIIFAPSVDEGGVPSGLQKYDVEFGSVELRPPFIYDPVSTIFSEAHWEVNRDGKAVSENAPSGVYGDGGGLPIARWSDTQIPSGRMDGSTAMENMFEIGPPQGQTINAAAKSEIMKSWWPFATGYR